MVNDKISRKYSSQNNEFIVFYYNNNDFIVRKSIKSIKESSKVQLNAWKLSSRHCLG